MLMPKNVLEGIERGEVDLAFRRWTRPTVKSGGTLRTRVGMLLISSVDPVDIGDITTDDARRAGTDLGDLLDFLEAKTDGTVYRVELGGVVPDPRVALREGRDLTGDDVAEITKRLDRLDRVGKRGPLDRRIPLPHPRQPACPCPGSRRSPRAGQDGLQERRAQAQGSRAHHQSLTRI